MDAQAEGMVFLKLPGFVDKNALAIEGRVWLWRELIFHEDVQTNDHTCVNEKVEKQHN